MMQFRSFLVFFFVCVLFSGCRPKETPADTTGATLSHDERMAWWREARFGLFIHWGLYAIPAGEWNGYTDYGEWIRHSAQIPLEEYDKFTAQFNPVEFNAREWVQLAKAAGMKYITITSKHHDGFCLWDSRQTGFDVMGTPFQRDILRELADACAEEGIRLCFYHSIMDWHHPDYLPRRPWETDRSTEGADFDRYVRYMKEQLRELTTNYGDIGVLWFDGEWEDTWTHAYGADLYDYVRGLKPDIIINNRVDKGRGGMAGMTTGDHKGDFGTPEQEIPATGLPGVDWESCMTMNRHWGYNRADTVWKSTADLLRKLADIASKGGNFLLNIGPMANGKFPPESIERLKGIGAWMQRNGESIYGTEASPFPAFDWGRVTLKRRPEGFTLYLHVFDWPPQGSIRLPGMATDADRAYLLAAPETTLTVSRQEDALLVQLPPTPLDPVNTVIAMEFQGAPVIYPLPVLLFENEQFIDEMPVQANLPDLPGLAARYTTDGSDPTTASPILTGELRLAETTTLDVRLFKGDLPVSGILKQTFQKVSPWPAGNPAGEASGVQYQYYEGTWNALPDFKRLKPQKSGMLETFDLSPKARADHYAFDFQAWINIPADGVYTFFTDSDDGSRLYIDGRLLVDNDGLHGLTEASGVAPLQKGKHRIRVTYFERDGGDELHVKWKGPGMEKGAIAPSYLGMAGN